MEHKNNRRSFSRDRENGVKERVAPPQDGKKRMRFAPLGGFEEIGRNMCFFEYDDEIVIIDAGLQFPEETTPGIDFIIPNVNYLERNKHKIRALIITHGHYDHTGAIPYVLPKLGNPTVYMAPITKEMVAKRHEEFRNLPKLDAMVVNPGDKVSFGKYFQAEFFTLDHTVPDTIGTILKTPIGNIVHFTDFKIDYDHDDNPIGLDDFERIGKMGVHTLLIDSTNADIPGKTVSERLVEKNLEILFDEASGRIIVSTFASLLTRLREMIKIAIKLKRKVFIDGYSMKTNIQIAQNMGYMKFPKDTIIPIEEINKYKDEKVIIFCTGAQGQSNASLMRIANGEHKILQTKPGDTFVLSSSIIPGNERGVQNLKDNLTRQGARVFQSKDIDIHSSGHAPADELISAIKLIKPKFMIPTHGYFFKRAANRELAVKCGIPKDNVLLLDNGHVAELEENKAMITGETIDSYYVMVDGLGVGDVGEVVLRDRILLSQEGMLVIIATIDKHNGRLLKNPDIISRGFIYLKESKEMMDEIRRKIRSVMERVQGQDPESDYVKTVIREQIGSFLFKKTKRRPMILPVVIEV
ncbi:MAG: ribonuclease J [Candidatus Harrisonbacteria bacterium]|nr:ribonuclease J [Candidatus Harrisonbacteria bacterium]